MMNIEHPLMIRILLHKFNFYFMPLIYIYIEQVTSLNKTLDKVKPCRHNRPLTFNVTKKYLYFYFSFQITTLVNHKEKAKFTEKTSRSLIRVGQGVALAVEKFVSVGQTIATENLEISEDMCEACEEARMAGKY